MLSSLLSSVTAAPHSAVNTTADALNSANNNPTSNSTSASTTANPSNPNPPTATAKTHKSINEDQNPEDFVFSKTVRANKATAATSIPHELLPTVPSMESTSRKIILNVLENYLKLISCCLNLTRCEVWSENPGGNENFVFISRQTSNPSSTAHSTNSLRPPVINLVCRSVLNGLQLVSCSNPPHPQIIALPLLSMNKVNFILIAQSTKPLTTESQLLLKNFSTCMSSSSLHGFLPVSESKPVEIAAEREHRKTLEDILVQALEMQYDSVSSRRVGDITREEVEKVKGEGGTRRSLDDIMEAVKATTAHALPDGTPHPRTSSSTNLSKVSESTSSTSSQKNDGNLSPLNTEDELLNKYTLEIFSEPGMMETMREIRFTKSR
ncbi:hypothetical protein TL16_g07676 [Triparma laevis f. inornata]|uniref:GAF domain-containing protein n=1 Tax=Triparma laevis f. inornata TaxID=1714386 RepID=A0A9W7EIJ1_9STRA|nr:hypothetical protein TL16_g07676 [Triparma laevis f. inornata]